MDTEAQKDIRVTKVARAFLLASAIHSFIHKIRYNEKLTRESVTQNNKDS
jgi:hypothetical protein